MTYEHKGRCERGDWQHPEKRMNTGAMGKGEFSRSGHISERTGCILDSSYGAHQRETIAHWKRFVSW